MQLRINLLPPEVAKKEVYKTRLRTINQLSIIFVSVMIIVTASVFALRLLQAQELSQANQKLDQTTSQIQSLNSAESLLANLKFRINKINSFAASPSKPITSLELIDSLKPATIATSYLGIDRQANVSFSGESSSSADLGTYFSNLTDDQKTEGRIAKVSSDNLTRIGPGRYKFDLTINFK